MTTITERLRFSGRYAAEDDQQCTARKNQERTEAADTIDALMAALEESSKQLQLAGLRAGVPVYATVLKIDAALALARKGDV